MKTTSRMCIVLSDYPIKTIAYQRFLSGLGELTVHSFREIGLDLTNLVQARLVVCDMNIMVEFEAEALARLEQMFPNSNILFLEEDHSDMLVKFSNQRDVCRLGKLAEISVIHSTLKELLLHSNQKIRRTPRSRTNSLEPT
ncbi:hypothetical protein [Limnobacter sp.]|uniref:hypothetical protein n=1 Tax=Limnobacter sp. TaxID=2003368 RepID=UPI002FDF5D96